MQTEKIESAMFDVSSPSALVILVSIDLENAKGMERWRADMQKFGVLSVKNVCVCCE